MVSAITCFAIFSIPLPMVGFKPSTCGLYCKCFAIIIYGRKLRFTLQRTLRSQFTLPTKAKFVRIIVLLYRSYYRAVITIVNYDRKTFLLQTTEDYQLSVQLCYWATGLLGYWATGLLGYCATGLQPRFAASLQQILIIIL
jgi:hypothetical protein